MIKSVQKAVTILKLLSDRYPDGMKLEEIAWKTEINKSTCVHLLDTLIDEKLAERMHHATYRLAAGCFHLTRFGKYDASRLAVCRPVLKWLHRQVAETVLIAEIQNCTKYVVDYIEGDVTLSVAPVDIIVDNMYRTATGRLILSHMPRAGVAEIVYKCGLPTSPDWSDFKSLQQFENALDELKKERVVYSYSSKSDCLCCGMAAGIFDGDGIVGALGIAFSCNGIAHQIESKENKYEKYLVRASEEMTARLSFGQ